MWNASKTTDFLKSSGESICSKRINRRKPGATCLRSNSCPEGLIQTYFPVNKVHAIQQFSEHIAGIDGRNCAADRIKKLHDRQLDRRKRTQENPDSPLIFYITKTASGFTAGDALRRVRAPHLALRKTVMGPVDARAHPRLRGRPFLSSRQNTRRAAHLPGLRRSVRRIGEDMTEMLVYVPGRFKIIRHIREKLFRRTRYRSRRGGADHAIARGRAGAGLLAISSSPSSTVGDA